MRIALSVMTAVLLSGCGGSPVAATYGELCDQQAMAYCMRGVECEQWPKSQCYQPHFDGCCTPMGCLNKPVSGDSLEWCEEVLAGTGCKNFSAPGVLAQCELAF